MRRLALALPLLAVGGIGAWVATITIGSGNGAPPGFGVLADEMAAETTTTTTTTSTTTTTTTTTTTVPPPRTATLAFTGDLLPHRPVVRAAARHAAANGAEGWDFRAMFDEVHPFVSEADLAICHLETPVSYDDTSLRGYPRFNAPRALVEGALDAGFDGCSIASNHSFDRGAAGVVGTLDAMDEIGMLHAGMARSEQEDLAPRLYDANAITVAHISATYGLNGFSMPADRAYLVDLIDPQAILAEAAAARLAGAEFVVVSLHWGTEYRHEPNSAQNEWLAAILPSPDVDIVIGHHAHVVQPVDRVDGKWVVFGLGNFLSNQSGSCCVTASQDGMIATVALVEDREANRIEISGIHYTPTWVDRRNGFVIRIARSGRLDVPAETAAALEASEMRTRRVVSSRLGPAEGLTSDLDLETVLIPAPSE